MVKLLDVLDKSKLDAWGFLLNLLYSFNQVNFTENGIHKI